jgi:hypothetical protein
MDSQKTSIHQRRFKIAYAKWETQTNSEPEWHYLLHNADVVHVYSSCIAKSSPLHEGSCSLLAMYHSSNLSARASLQHPSWSGDDFAMHEEET